MFKFKELTDFEKLQFARSYIHELKNQLDIAREGKKKAVKEKNEFIIDFKNYSTKFSKLSAYKKEMKAVIALKSKAERDLEKSERKNFKYRQRIRELEEKYER